MITFPFETVDGLLASYDKTDLRDLSKLCAGIPGDYIEIGSYRGLSSLCIACEMPASKALHCYDWFEPDKLPTFRANIEAAGFTPVVKVFVGECRQTMLGTIPAEIAFAFVDHDHALNSTVFVYDMIWPRLSRGGIIAFHDYLHPDFSGPTEFLKAIEGDRAIERGGLLAIRKP